MNTITAIDAKNLNTARVLVRNAMRRMQRAAANLSARGQAVPHDAQLTIDELHAADDLLVAVSMGEDQ